MARWFLPAFLDDAAGSDKIVAFWRQLVASVPQDTASRLGKLLQLSSGKLIDGASTPGVFIAVRETLRVFKNPKAASCAFKKAKELQVCARISLAIPR